MAERVTEPSIREPRVVLSVNVGSSSLKTARFRCSTNAEEVLARHDEAVGEQGFASALDRAFEALAQPGGARPDAIGHRVVHGGPHHSNATIITPALIEELRALIPLAPLHQPAALLAIDVATNRFDDVPQVACFDTAFHRHMPEVAQRFALPEPFWTEGIRRYGFHGLSYEYVVEELGEALGRRAIVAHLGNGASMVALRDGEPLDTTMGLTPMGGLVMGTRTGDLDPGVMVYLAREQKLDADGMEALVESRSGLLGVSGSTSNMQALLDARSSDHAARVAVELFCYAARKQIGALAAVLGGVDSLVFTGGIGEHAAPVRAEICAGLEHLNVALDPSANDRHAPMISVADSPCTVRVFPTDEDRMIARITARLLSPPRPSSRRT
jgi:acetate kinase